jgi:unsaturated rhamnogalacturonyl hydrolase
MTRTTLALLAFGIFVIVGPPTPAAGPGAVVTVKNPVDLPRPAETIVLGAEMIRKVMPADDLRNVHVTDDATGKEVLTQPVDTNDDGTFDEVVFQADLGGRATRTFSLSIGERQVFTRDQFKAYGRFVRERRDDYAWENDRTAHRMYGKALETWAQEPLTSSSVDVWFKRTRRLVINEWYMVDDYHRDNGEGADLYSAGKSRGCGGNGIWDGGTLYASANFVGTRTLANGPIRVMFELTYPAWDAAGKRITEVKRVTLDAGHNLNRFESRYAGALAGPLVQAAGIKKHPDAIVGRDKARGVLRTWEPVKADGSHFGCAIVADPAGVLDFAEADGNVLLVAGVPASGVFTYYAGAGWDKSGDFPTPAVWEAYVDQAARRLAAPVSITIAAR